MILMYFPNFYQEMNIYVYKLRFKYRRAVMMKRSVVHCRDMRFRFLSVLWGFGVERPTARFLNLMEIP